MDERSTTERAKTYIDALARGIDPLTGHTLPEGDIVNNVRISRCLFYVSGILARVLEQGFPQAGGAASTGEAPRAEEASLEKETAHTEETPRRRAKKAAFFLTDSQRSTLAAHEGSVFARDIAAQLSRFADENQTRGFAAAWISAWLMAEGFMEQTEQGKRATELGAELGIETMQREHADGTPYLVNKYNAQAQQFILDNFDVIVAFKAKRKEQS